jgi:hypothetical protein
MVGNDDGRPEIHSIKAKEPPAMMPPQYLSTIVEERQRELRNLAQPFEMPQAITAVRGRLSRSLIRLGNAIAVAGPPLPSGDASRAGLSTQ